jgi:hypothetical protein
MKENRKKVNDWFQAIVGAILFLYGFFGLGLEFLGLFVGLIKYSFLNLFYGKNTVHDIANLSIILGVGVFLLKNSVIEIKE